MFSIGERSGLQAGLFYYEAMLLLSLQHVVLHCPAEIDIIWRGAYVALKPFMADCVYRQWFLEVFLGPFSNVYDRIMPMSDAVLSEGPKTMGIQQRSSALSLMHRDFSSFSESVDDVMHCR